MLIAKLMLVYKKCKASFAFKNKLFKYVFFNICSLFTYLLSEVIINSSNRDIIIASLI
jgi:hypothetical protein